MTKGPDICMCCARPCGYLFKTMVQDLRELAGAAGVDGAAGADAAGPPYIIGHIGGAHSAKKPGVVICYRCIQDAKAAAQQRKFDVDKRAATRRVQK